MNARMHERKYDWLTEKMIWISSHSYIQWQSYSPIIFWLNFIPCLQHLFMTSGSNKRFNQYHVFYSSFSPKSQYLPVTNGPMDTGCQWEAHPTSHSYWMKLHQRSWAITVRLLGRDWHWGQSLHEKKSGYGEPGETPCLLPCATKGCFSAPKTLLCSRCTYPALGALQHPCFDSIFAQFCSFAATCAFKVLCSTSCALQHKCFTALDWCRWSSSSWSPWCCAWFLQIPDWTVGGWIYYLIWSIETNWKNHKLSLSHEQTITCHEHS